MLSFPSHCFVCGEPFSISHECPPRAFRARCTPPVPVAPVVSPVASAACLPAPAEAGGGECTPGLSLDAVTLRLLRRQWRHQVKSYGRYDRVTRDTYQRLRWCAAYLIGQGC